MQNDVVFDPGAEEYEMPCAEAMLAGTLALMTAFAQSNHPQHGRLMAKKIVSNLFFLAQHPRLSGEFRQVLLRMKGAWDGLVCASAQEGVGSASVLSTRMPECPTLQ